MEKPKINIFTDATELARSVAAFMIEAINKGPCHIALSGGSTPNLLFNLLSKKNHQQVYWDNAHFYWVDERCVPPNDPESNFGTCNQLLFEKIKLPERNINRMLGETDPATEAKRYAKLLQAKVPSHRNGLPAFDILLLGMGSDGHTASIFPDQMDLLTNEKFCAVAIQPETGQKRITLTGPVINHGKNIIFMITGESKAQMAGTILHQKEGYDHYPSAHIQSRMGNLRWYLDQSAASRL